MGCKQALPSGLGPRPSTPCLSLRGCPVLLVVVIARWASWSQALCAESCAISPTASVLVPAKEGAVAAMVCWHLWRRSFLRDQPWNDQAGMKPLADRPFAGGRGILSPGRGGEGPRGALSLRPAQCVLQHSTLSVLLGSINHLQLPPLLSLDP